MALANVNILRQDGGIARQSASQDGISGLIIYSTALSGYSGNYKLFTAQDGKDLFTGSTLNEQIAEYHIDGYFNRSDDALYFKVIPSATTDFSEIVELKDFAEGEPRQYGVIDLETDFSTSRVSLLDTAANQLETEFAPGQVLYSAPITGTVENLTSLQLLSDPRVSVNIAEDATAGSVPADLRANSGATFIGSIGQQLGDVSSVKVSTSIAYVREINLADFGYSNPGFIDGSVLKDKSKTFQDTLDTYHYTFIRKFVGLGGSYWNFAYTAVNDAQSDFNTIELNRTYDKAFRNIRTALLPEVCSPVLVDQDGNLSNGVVKYLESLAGAQLQFMQDANEISDYVVSIDPNQKVLQTNTIEVVAKIVPVGVAKTIEVKLGFTTSL